MKTMISQLLGNRNSPPPTLKDPNERDLGAVQLRKLQEDLARRPLEQMEKKKEATKSFDQNDQPLAEANKRRNQKPLKKIRQTIDFGVKGVGAIVQRFGKKVEVEMIGERSRINTAVDRPVLTPSLSKNILGQTGMEVLKLSTAIKQTAHLVRQKMTIAIEKRTEGITEDRIGGAELSI